MDSPAEILRRHGLAAKKSWGQCFLHDSGVVSRIVEASGVGAGDTVVELGAGLGVLTSALEEQGARIIAVERDRDLAQILRQEFAGRPQVEVLEANALTLKLDPWGGALKVVGNLPYNIASPLIFHLLDQWPRWRSATLMVQREVAERLAAGPGSRTYGAPSVICQRLATVRTCFIVGRGAFFPQPRVDSAVIHLEIRPTPVVSVEETLFRQVVHAAFRHRRQTLRRGLGRSFSAVAVQAALQQAGVDGALRPESLTVEQFAHLTQGLISGHLLADGRQGHDE